MLGRLSAAGFEKEETISRYPISGSRYPSWKTGLPDIHPEKPDFQTSVLETGPPESQNLAPESYPHFFRTEISSLNSV
jgi:hypothetical protein